MVRDLNNPDNSVTLRGVKIAQNKKDGWNNALIGLGKRNIDKTMETTFGEVPYFTDDELSHMFMGDGLAKRIITLRPKDGTRAWINIPGDPKDVILKELKRLGAQVAFRKAWSWARLYRGAVIVIVEKGNIDLSKPLSRNVKQIEALRVYSAARINTTYTDVVDDPSSIYFDEVEYFPIRLRNGVPIQVHASRCLVFKGEEAPDDGVIDFKYKYWGTPVMMEIYDRLKNMGSAEQSIANLLLEFNIGKYTLSNLAQMLASNDEATLEKIYTRMDVINASKSIINSVLLGDGESYERDSAAVSGVDALLDRMMIFLSAVSGYPVTKLFGRSPAGQNATGESDIRNYYDDVSSEQETYLEPPLQKLVDLIGSYSNVSDTTIEFNPLWQPTEKEMADTDKVKADTYEIYMRNGVLGPDEVRGQEFAELGGIEPIMPEEKEEE